MTRRWTTPLLLIAVFGGSLAGTLVTRSAKSSAATQPAGVSPVASWLGLGADQEATLHKQDPTFTTDLNDARETLDKQRMKLADMFEQSNVSDQDLRQQIDVVITAGNHLERRVADHLITVRKHLTGDQQRRLFGLCAKSVRACCCQDGGKAACCGKMTGSSCCSKPSAEK